MSGETEADPSGMTPDILRHFFQNQLDSLQAQLGRRLETEHAYDEAQRNAVQAQLNDLKVLLNERYSTQMKLLDERWATQTRALQVIVVDQQTARTEAEKAVTTALASQEKAVAKAETAAERRFESVNEFRGQLADQAATFLPRPEADIRFTAVAERLDAIAERIAKNELALTGVVQRGTGSTDTVADRRQALTLFIAGAGALLALASIVVVIIIAVKP